MRYCNTSFITIVCTPWFFSMYNTRCIEKNFDCLVDVFFLNTYWIIEYFCNVDIFTYFVVPSFNINILLTNDDYYSWLVARNVFPCFQNIFNKNLLKSMERCRSDMFDIIWFIIFTFQHDCAPITLTKINTKCYNNIHNAVSKWKMKMFTNLS